MPDRSAVETFINEYSLAYDTHDLQAMAAKFTQDATFTMVIAGGDPISFESKETIMKLMTDSMATQTDQRRHINTNLIVDSSDPEVTRTTHYLTLVGTENGVITLISAGVYRLEIVEVEGKLAMRTLHLELDRAY